MPVLALARELGVGDTRMQKELKGGPAQGCRARTPTRCAFSTTRARDRASPHRRGIPRRGTHRRGTHRRHAPGRLRPDVPLGPAAGPTRVLDAARTGLEAGSTGDRVRVRATLDTAGRDQVGRLLGLPWVSSGKPVTLGLLRAACARNGTELMLLLEALGGPLRDRRAEKADADAALQQRRDRTRAALAAIVGGCCGRCAAAARSWRSAPTATRLAAASPPSCSRSSPTRCRGCRTQLVCTRRSGSPPS